MNYEELTKLSAQEKKLEKAQEQEKNVKNKGAAQAKSALASYIQTDDEQLTLPIERLQPYRDHPFKLYTGERFDALVESIKALGVVMPVIVRALGNSKYEILSGHNRVNAAKTAGLDEVPAVLKEDLNDEDAALIVTETNLIQRSFSDLSHSERAVALKTHMSAIKAQGKRSDIINEVNSLLNVDENRGYPTSGLLVPKLESRDKAAEKYGLDARSVSRYLRLAELEEHILKRVDNGEIGLYPAVSLSYLTAEEQKELDSFFGNAAYKKIDMKKAELLRELSANKKLTADKMVAVLSGKYNKKPKPKTPPPLKIKHTVYSKYFDDSVSAEERENIIDKALELYFSQTGE
ncbi:MAG: ParB N-terminal domain-containing protein [Oscillospiraceae bacterium]|nr:ParB N-terminal domain-containing protein [Oscillospiraceae bacterium]